MVSNPVLTIDGKIVANSTGGVCYRPPSDITPPTVVLENTPANRTPNTSTNITIATNDVVAYKYKLDNNSYGNEILASIPILLSELSEAEHTLYVIGKDAANNWQTTPTTYTWTVDLTPPVATLTNTPTNPTSATTTDITVGGEDVVAYKYKLDSGSWIENTIETHIQLSGLTETSHTLSVIGKDSAGNWKPENEATTYTWIVNNSFVTNGLYVHYDISNPTSYPQTGTTVYDLSGRAKNATLYNGVAYDSNSGGSLDFNGTTHYGYIGAIGLSNDSTPFSFGAWVKRHATGRQDRIICNNDGNVAYTQQHNSIVFFYQDKLWMYHGRAQVWGCGKTSVMTFAANTWYYVSGTFNGTRAASGFRLYVNGNEISTTDYGSTFGTAGSSQDIWYIGVGRSGDGKIDGNIANVHIYNRTLSAAEVLQNYNATKTRFGL